MRKVGLVVIVVLASGACRQVAPPPKPAPTRSPGSTPAPSQHHAKKSELPRFPTDEAKWLIRGKTRARAPLLSRSIATGMRPRLASTVGDGDRAYEPLGLGLPGVFVYVEGLERRWRFAPQSDGVVIELRAGRVRPHVTGIVVGADLTIRSRLSDPLELTYLDASTGRGVAGMALGRGKDGHLVASRSGTIICQYQPSLSGHVHVVPHPMFAVSDDEGRFALAKLPDGDYELVAIHQLLGKVTKKVTIQGRHPPPLTFVFDLPTKLRAEGKK